VGDFWALIFLIGLVARPLLLFCSFGVVILLAVNVAALGSRPSAAWKLVVLHAVFVMGGGFAVEIAAGWWSVFSVHWAWLPVASAFVVPVALYRKLRRLRRQVPASGEDPSAAEKDRRPEVEELAGTADTKMTTRERKTANRVAWTIGVTGTFAPWLVGLGVKIYLQSVGEPTLPVASFLEPVVLPFLVIATVTMWSFPFLLLALLARFVILPSEKLSASFRGRLWLVWLTFAGGMVVTPLVFKSVFWKFETIFLFIPMGLYICPSMVLGFGAGVLLIRKRWIRG
jgi:hypothetical protein